MVTDLVELTSSSDSEIELCGTSPPKLAPRRHNISISDDEFPDVDFGIPRINSIASKNSENQIQSQYVLPQRDAQDIEFSYTTFTQINTRPVQVNPEIIPAVTQQPTRQVKQMKSKADKAYEKALKAAQTADKKCAKAGDCFKSITAHLDSRLLDSISGSSSILSQLETLGVKHKIESSLVPKSIWWKRESIEHYVDENLKVCSRSAFTEEKDALVIIPAREFNLLAQRSLSEYYDKILRSLKKDRITLVVYGLVQMFREQKTKGNRQFKERCSEKNRGATSSQMPQGMDDDVILSPAEMEEAKINLLLERQCSIWPVENPDELAKTIAHLSKAVAERPFKEDRMEQPFDFYAAEASVGGVRVAKDGQGLTRLWQQQIQQFPLAALETSQAIVSKYPTPAVLAQAYQDCGSEKEASLLLQDIPVRRNAGPLSTTRKVGPELSKRMHKFMTSKDGGEIL